MKKWSILSTALYLVASFFYVMSIITFSRGNDTAMGAVWLSLGSTFLCGGTVLSRKTRAEEQKQDETESDPKE